MIVGDWNLLAVSGTYLPYNWTESKCNKLEFRNGTNNQYNLTLKVNKMDHGPWNLIPDPKRSNDFYGYFLDTEVIDKTVPNPNSAMRVVYYNNNEALIASSYCFLAYISQNSTQINATAMAAFQGYL